jgi:hypothetical protein
MPDPARVPHADVDVAKIKKGAAKLHGAAEDIRTASGAVLHAWYPMRDYCPTPGDKGFYEAMTPLGWQSLRFAEQMDQLGDALERFAANIGPIVAELKEIQAEPEGPTWALEARREAAIAAFEREEAACALAVAAIDIEGWPTQAPVPAPMADGAASSTRQALPDAGDSWLLAALAATGHRDPHFLEAHAVRNEDGSWTLALSRNGMPAPMTISAEAAQSVDTDDDGNPHIPALFRVALSDTAAHPRLNFSQGKGAEVMEILTGSLAVLTDKLDLAAIGALAAEGPVTVESHSFRRSGWWVFSDDGGPRPHVIPDHDYWVQSVEPHGPDAELMVHVRSPWDSFGLGGAAADLWLTEAQFMDRFVRASAVALPPGV